MEQSRRLALRKLVLTVDALAIVVSMTAAFWLHSALRELLPILKAPPHFRSYAALAYLTLPLWMFLIWVLGLHRCFERRWTPLRAAYDLVKLHLLGLAGLALILFLTQAIINRTLVLLFLACTLSLMWLARLIIGLRLKQHHAHGFGQLRLLLVGGSVPEMSAFVERAGEDLLPPRVVGYLSSRTRASDPPLEFEEGFPPGLGDLRDLEQVLLDEAVDQVLFFPPFDRAEMVPEAMILLRSLGVPAGFSVQPMAPFEEPPQMVSLYGDSFVSVQVAPKRPEALALKYALDTFLAAVALLLISPLMISAALAIRVSMGRPVFFVQERAGLFGRRFRLIKFRTMTPTAESERDRLLDLNEMAGPVFKIQDDPRVTRVGRFLRRASIDELPQLLNVLAGSMSLVGPRPLPIKEQQQIRGWHRRRLSMKPGITGLWQVSGRSDVDFEEWMKLDLKYIDEWSLGLDLRILLRTIPAVLFAKGSR